MNQARSYCKDIAYYYGIHNCIALCFDSAIKEVSDKNAYIDLWRNVNIKDKEDIEFYAFYWAITNDLERTDYYFPSRTENLEYIGMAIYGKIDTNQKCYS